MDCVMRHIERQIVETAHARRHRECELGARAEPGVGRNCFLDDEIIVGVQTELTPHAFQVIACTRVIRPLRLCLRRRLDRYRRAQFLEREADAAETTPEAAVQIHEAEVQPCRNRYRHALGDGSRTAHAGLRRFSRDGSFAREGSV